MDYRLEDEPMAVKQFEQVLADARQLPRKDQERLVDELSKAPSADAPPASANGSTRSLLDALQERGLIGCLTDAPADLSTNPRYMEGFGQDAR